MPEADLLEVEGVTNEFGEAAVAEEAGEFSAEEGGVRMLTGTRGAGAGCGPVEGWGEVGLALVVGILGSAGPGDFTGREEIPDDEVAF